MNNKYLTYFIIYLLVDRYKYQVQCFLLFRYEISDEAAAALANGLLRDFNIVSDSSNHEVLDGAKVRREKVRVGDHEVKERGEVKLKCIGTDGKKVKKAKAIKVNEINGEKTITRTTDTIDYYTYTIESGTNYLSNLCICLSIFLSSSIINCFLLLGIFLSNN